MDKKKRIIEKTRELISKKGYYETTMKEIAGEAGVAQGTPYLYFRNKEEIFFEIIMMFQRNIDDRIEKAIEYKGDFWAKLEHLICDMGLYFKKNRETVNVIHNITNEPKGIGKKGREKIKAIQDMRLKKINNIFKVLGRDKAGIKGYTDKEVARFCGIVIEGILRRVAEGIEQSPQNASKFVVKCLKSTFGS
ncbi:MAG: helix-turn-helix transcriptional regulator [Elusimicrobia bacterium]|nr:helix-turn-helix transcriptional regulator [Elusimicrobiota bacterium]